MASRKHKSSTPPPRSVVNALKLGRPVDRDLLLDWYTNAAPEWIRKRGISADLAVFLWDLPTPLTWDHLEMLIKKDEV